MASRSGAVFFYRPWEAMGFLSQWHRCPVKVPVTEILQYCPESKRRWMAIRIAKIAVKGMVQFNCAEQGLMFCKAVCFGDTMAASSIHRESWPSGQRAIGRRVAGYDEEVWQSLRWEIAVMVNRAKFAAAEHGSLRSQLMETHPCALVEASPKDRIWGIGFDARDALGREAEWGQNVLGRVLMQVRQEIRDSEEEKLAGESGDDEAS